MIKQKDNIKGVASLVFGLTGIVFSWMPVTGLVLGILAIVYSVKQSKIEKNGLATAGLVLGILTTIFGAMYNVFWFFSFIGLMMAR